MKIISWNVNGFRSVATKFALADLVNLHDPDILFLQEIKSTEDQINSLNGKYINSLNGDYIWHIDGSTIPGRHGVAMFIKESLLDSSKGDYLNWLENVDPSVDGNPEARLQVFVYNGILFINTYSVNVRPDLSRVEQRAAYDHEIYKILQMWKDQGNTKAIVLGDFNVVSEAVDYHGPNLNPSLAGMTDSERNSFKNLLHGHNLKDTFRELNPDAVKYSYWSYRGYAREANKGWRIDYVLATPDMLNEIETADILTDITGSDHAPVMIEIKDT